MDTTMAQNEYIKKGYLLKCPQKALNPFKQKWQTRWFVLYGNSEHGRVRIEYHDSEKAWQQEKGKRVIPLSNCVSIKPVWNKVYNYVIEIVIQDKTLHLAADSKEEEKAWFKDLCKVIFGNANRNSMVQVIDKPASDSDFGYHSLDRGNIDNSKESPRTLHTVQESLHESSSREEVRSIGAIPMSGGLNDNTSVDGNHGSREKLLKTLTSSVASELSSLVSFESGFDDASSVASTVVDGSNFPVTIRPTIASQKADMNGTYLLQITPLHIILIDIPSQSPICEWPIQFLRRYGRGRTKFSFEANEKCKHGKGVYTFNTLEGDSIFHLVDMHARGISLRNQMLRKRTSMPDGFKPIGAVLKKLHHSEGQLIDKLPISIANGNSKFGDSTSDILVLNPSDSVSQSGTLEKDLQIINENKFIKSPERNYSFVCNRGGTSSIGSGISLEIAQNMSQTELKDHKNIELNDLPKLEHDTKEADSKCVFEIFDSSFEDGTTNTNNKVDVPAMQEETLAQTLQADHRLELKTDSLNSIDNLRTVNSGKPEGGYKKVKRSSSLKLPSALKRSNSSKDSSIKKSHSVKRSSSFRNRFFKSKTNDEAVKVEKKENICAKTEQDLLVEELKNFQSPAFVDIDVKIAQQKKVKEILSKAIEDDMNRNSECELINGNYSQIDKIEKVKPRKFPVRHKSNEMLGNGTPDKSKLAASRLSSSFAGYDYKGHMVLLKTSSVEKENEAEELRRLQRRTQSVMKKVELYEGLKQQADDYKAHTYTFWKRRHTHKEQKPKIQEVSTETFRI